MLAVIYAQALYQSSRSLPAVKCDELLENLKNVLARKGHGRLLPQVVREFEKLLRRQSEGHGIVQVARKQDATRLKAQIEQACAALHIDPEVLVVQENDTLIGGFLLREKTAQIDGSYRRKLIELYRQFIAA